MWPRLEVTPERLRPVMRTVGEWVSSGRIPGAVTAIAADGVVVVEAFGLARRVPVERALRDDSIFDLASVTKVTATLPLTLQLASEGRLELDAPVGRYLPDAAWLQPEPTVKSARVRQLLTHTSGLPAWRPVYATSPSPAHALQQFLQMPLERPAGAAHVYSDIGLILLGEIVRRTGGERLDQAFRRRVAVPLGMADTGYRPFLPELPGTPGGVPEAPDPTPPDGRMVATEACPWRGRVMAGEVHDENCWSLGGVAGHAGLFGTALDLVRYGLMWLGGGTLDGVQVLSDAACREALRPQGGDESNRHGLGWFMPGPAAGSFGTGAPPGMFGHTGFTGTGLWVDPTRAVVTALLTNRVHPSRQTDSGITELRGRFHEALREAVPPL